MAEMTVKKFESKEELFALIEKNNNICYGAFFSSQDRHGDAYVQYTKYTDTWTPRGKQRFEEERLQEFRNVNGHVFWFRYERCGNPEAVLRYLLERLEAFIESGKRETVYRWNAFEKGSMRVSSR